MKNNPLKPLQPGSRPMLPGIPDPTCPTLLEAKSMLEKTRDLHRAMRRLRRSTQRCPTCPERAVCPSMRNVYQAMDGAIREVCQEWGLDEQ